MPLNVKKTLVDQLWLAYEARPGFTSIVKASNRQKPNDPTTLRLSTGGSAMPKKFPSVFVTASGFRSGEHPKTFAHGAPTTVLDYAVPLTGKLETRTIFDCVIEDAVTALEAEIDAALHGFYIRLHAAGFRWASSPTWDSTRANRCNAETGGILRTVITHTASINCRVMLSQLTN